MTHLCVAIFVNDVAQAKRDIALAAEAGADLVELRVDSFAEPAALAGLAAQSILPLIVTCRPTWEGGQSEQSDDERLTVLNVASVGNTRYLDVELETARRSPN